ncbi:Putative 115 kDa protein in type-1 retrotransposable element R1DM [Eumeta japonica]|uniref:115 kDa protein in type-1 retrotransposable element R1DM n=1 Tax=Eumeta variegata TaxID=151549 RepID=A0A4C1VQA7_EUMVA|nr:Putative 115 kDa protein in type-1 retrotransposable element R1DM [Eumeta japonica]
MKFGHCFTPMHLAKLRIRDSSIDREIHGQYNNCPGRRNARLLGLTIDKRLTFTSHVAKACKKTANIYKGVARAAKAMWVLSSEIVRTIYVAVIQPIVMYAS